MRRFLIMTLSLFAINALLPIPGLAVTFQYLTEDVQNKIKDESTLQETVDKMAEGIIDDQQLSVDETVTELRKLDDEKKKLKEQLDMFGFNFGVGLLMAHYHGKQRVESTQVVNNKVVVDDGDNDLAGAIFETHNLRWNPYHGAVYLGPFLGVQTTNEQLLDSVILGLMAGTTYRDSKPGSFNIGIGYIWDPGTKVLADGFEANQPLPAGEQGVRTKKVTQKGWGIVVSYGF